MSQIVVSDNFEQQFAGVTSMTEVRDKDGRLLGHFVPSQDRATLAQL